MAFRTAHDVLPDQTWPTGRPAARRSVPAARGVRYAIAALLLLGAFLADLDTGYDLSSSLFYIVPVAFTAWFVGRRAGLFAAFSSSAGWFACQRLAGIA